MMSKLLVVVAALCVASAAAVTVEVDAINGFPSADAATFKFNGETVLDSIPYKGKGTKDVTVTTTGPYSVDIGAGGGDNTYSGTLSAGDLAALTGLGDSWASFATYQDSANKPAVIFTGLPKSTLNTISAGGMIFQIGSALQSTLSNYPNVRLAYAWGFSAETSGITVSTDMGPLQANINDAGFASVITVSDATATQVSGVTYTNKPLRFKIFEGTTSITSMEDFNTKTALIQSGEITIKKGETATCVIIGKCEGDDLTACAAKTTYGLDVVCDEINWAGAAGALKPTVLFALLAAAVAMLFAW